MNKWMKYFFRYFFQTLDDDDSAHLGQIVFLKNLFHLFSKRNIPISLEMKDTKVNVINT